jgi:2-amino-4-hydroxy-6-hydroxymethyldihydropteridine diphosphokinase
VGDFVIGMGANLGAREVTLARAACEIAALAQVRLLAASLVYETEPVGIVEQPRFLNAALRVTSELTADALFERLLAIELAHGRVRLVRWGPRTLDLDLLWGSRRVDGERLQVPHARLCERTFALAPLLDVAPELAGDYAPALAQLGGPPAGVGRLVVEAFAATGTSVRFDARLPVAGV